MRKKKSIVKHYEKLLKRDNDFDYSYLLLLERFKITRMIDSFVNASVPHVGIEFTIRDLKLCKSLLDIVLEEDSRYKTYLDSLSGSINLSTIPTDREGYSKLVIEHDSVVKFPGYINHRNLRRFMRDVRFDSNESMWNLHVLIELRKVKALYLYNKIRNRMYNWWW